MGEYEKVSQTLTCTLVISSVIVASQISSGIGFM